MTFNKDLKHPLHRFAGALRASFILLVLTLCHPLLAQDVSFDAYHQKADDTLLVRLDALPPALAQTALTGVEVSLDGGPAQALTLAARPRFERTMVSLKTPSPGQLRDIRLRFLSATARGSTPGPWSAPQPVITLPRDDTPLERIAAQDWEWRTHPTRADTVQLRFATLPDSPRRPLSGIAIRANWHDIRVTLPPQTDRWIDLPLKTYTYGRGRPIDLYIAPLSGNQRGRWSPPDPVVLTWQGPSRVPDAAWPTDWLVRDTGVSGEALVEVVIPPTAHLEPLVGIEARVTPVDARFAPLATAPDWHPLALDTPAKGGQARLSGLQDGQLYTVELRGISKTGAGQPSAPKIVTPRAFGLPHRAVIGDLNGAGQGRIRVAKGSVIAEGSGWQITRGTAGAWDWLAPTGPMKTRLSTVTLTSGTRVEIERRPRSFVAETPQDLAAFLDLPADAKSGATLLIGAHWLDTQKMSADFDGAFTGLRAPLTIVPREPALGTQLTRWWIGNRDPEQTSGALVMRDIDMIYPEALWVQAGRPRTVSVIDTSHSHGPVRDLRLMGVRIRSDAMPARLGYAQRTLIRAADFEKAEAVQFVNGEIAHIVYGLRVALVDSLTRGNTMHHMIADPININMIAGARGRDVVIEHNTAFNFMGDGFLLHGDGTHMWVHGGGGNAPARIARLQYRGNVIFPGWEGVKSPPSMSALFEIAPYAQDLTISPGNDHQLVRVDATQGPVTVTLPPMAQTRGLVKRRDQEMVFAVQKSDRGPHPVVLRAAPGETIGETRRGEITLTGPFQALELRARPQTRAWVTFVPVPALQGFYADRRGTDLPGLEIEANIFWGLSLRQISPGNRPQASARVHHNAVLMPLPGDLDGDGQWNTPSDGVTRKAGQILVPAADGTVAVFANIAGRTELMDSDGRRPLGWNNADLTWTKRSSNIPALFSGAQVSGRDPAAITWFPQTRAEAIALARPAPGSSLAIAGQGPLGVTPDTDWWDFRTGQRGAAATRGDLAVETFSPAPNTQTPVSAQIDALRLDFNAPVAPGRGQITLYAEDTATPVARWSLTGRDPTVQAAGPRLALKLPQPLRDGIRYRVEADPGSLRDVWGRVWPGLPKEGWHFTASTEVYVNQLPQTDITQSPWRMTGLESARGATSDALHLVHATAKNNRLRIVLEPPAGMRRTDRLSLRFEYRQTTPQDRPVSHLNGATPARIDWNNVPIGRIGRIAPGLWGRRTDVSTAAGTGPRTAYAAELFFDADLAQGPIDLDVLRAMPPGRSLHVGQLELVVVPTR